MLTKDKKPELKDGGKETKDVVPPPKETPKMFRAALKVAEQAGIEGAFTKLRGAYKQADDSQVRAAPVGALTAAPVGMLTANSSTCRGANS